MRAHANPVATRAGRRRLQPGRNLDPLLYAFVVGRHEVAVGAHAELADAGWVRACQDSNDLALGPAVGAGASDAYQNAVAVHGVVGGAGGNEDVAAQALTREIGNQEAVAIAVHLEAAGSEFAGLAGGDVLPAAQFDQVAARGEARQRALKFLARRAARPQLANQLLEVRARVGQPGDVLEDRLGVHSSTKAQWEPNGAAANRFGNCQGRLRSISTTTKSSVFGACFARKVRAGAWAGGGMATG